ncbi:MAG: hypothetical protein L7F77_16465 [Candidatus Magnetominusculus sp. LBB02]|nr:hypothetical protein [Candidatus Magnetominusculus sp. LBB02]
MSNGLNQLKDAAISRYNEIGSIIQQKKDEIDSLLTEYNALKSYLVSMSYVVDEAPAKRRGRKPKDKTGVVVEKKTRGRKPKA